MAFKDGLKSLPPRDHKVVRYLSLGHRANDAAKKIRVSQGRISQLRRAFHDSWSKFTGEDPGDAAAAVRA